MESNKGFFRGSPVTTNRKWCGTTSFHFAPLWKSGFGSWEVNGGKSAPGAREQAEQK